MGSCYSHNENFGNYFDVFYHSHMSSCIFKSIATSQFC